MTNGSFLEITLMRLIPIPDQCTITSNCSCWCKDNSGKCGKTTSRAVMRSQSNGFSGRLKDLGHHVSCSEQLSFDRSKRKVEFF